MIFDLFVCLPRLVRMSGKALFLLHPQLYLSRRTLRKPLAQKQAALVRVLRAEEGLRPLEAQDGR